MGGLALIAALQGELKLAKEFIKKAQTLHPQCFLSELAKSFCFQQNDASRAKQQLAKTLNQTKHIRKEPNHTLH